MGIEVHEVTADRDELIAAVVVTRNATFPEVYPDDPAMGADEIRADLFGTTVQKRVRTWVALADGAPAGDISFELEDDEENAHLASSDWFAVVPGRRRRGVADALARRSLDDLAAEGRTSLLLWGHQAAPDIGRIYAERLGLTERTEERCSRMTMAEHDSALMDEWLASGNTRSDGYRMVQFGARCPDEFMGAYLQATSAMDDMPTDELEWAIAATDEALARSREDLWDQRRFTVARSLVLAPDDSGAGFSELFVSGFRPTLAWQGDTGVARDHRGHGLGRWVKAANLRYAQRLAPGFEVVETYNAQSNPWMLDINVAMGFRPHVIWRGFQGDLAAARAVLG